MASNFETPVALNQKEQAPPPPVASLSTKKKKRKKKKQSKKKKLSCIGMVRACVRAEEDPGAEEPELMKRSTAAEYSRANSRAAQIESASGSALPPMRAGTH